MNRAADLENIESLGSETGQGLLFIGGVPAIDIEGSRTSAVRGGPSGSGIAIVGSDRFPFECTAVHCQAVEHLRLRARAAVKYAVKTGALVRPSACERCGAPGKLESHHEDYARQLDVEWLCIPCHKKENRRAKQLARESLPNGAHSPSFKGVPSWMKKAINRKRQEQSA